MAENAPGHIPRRDSSVRGLTESGPVAVAPAAENSLTQALFKLVDSTELGGEEFGSRLAELEAEHGELVYPQLLLLLCHLRFEPEEAKGHWDKIVEHHRSLEERLGAPVDLRVALASYFINVHRRLENPTLIEMRLFERTRAFAYRDELTGLRNYRFFELYLFHELERSEQYAWPLSLILLDVDDFKPYNDRYGHGAGNEALSTIGRLVAESCRKVDVPARYGGEEFAIIVPATPKVGAQHLAERARRAIAEHPWSAQRLTVSVGVATYPGDATTTDGLLRSADEALYLAKAKGKNQVQLYGESRRSHVRVPIELAGQLFAPDGESHPVTTVDVSEAGLRFACDVELGEDSLVDLRLNLPGSERAITVAGRVVQSIRGSGASEAAVRVVDLSSCDRRLLVKYLSEVGERGGD